MKNFIFFLIIASLLGACSSDYYISPDGDDENSGKSAAQAWKTIQKVNETDFAPGSSILFEGGKEFEGTIQLSEADAGSAGREITISSYGDREALIKGGDKEGLLATNCDHLVVKDLIFEGSGRKSGNTTDGVLINGSDSVRIENLEVFGFQKSGLHVRKSVNAHITHVYAHNNGFAGIHVTGATMNDKTNYDNADLYIGYCVAENNPGDPTLLKNHSGNGILANS
ncbi:MAG: right-handed parallel beta-helix repeat-containing protein, partial [Bacteroidales bacterium]|nr:right-handed parallel beta-helix repeat-containing protein [Bacteroidales bacterium]